MKRKIIEILTILTLGGLVVSEVKQHNRIREVSDTLVAIKQFDMVTYKNVMALIHNTELLERQLHDLKKRIEI